MFKDGCLVCVMTLGLISFSTMSSHAEVALQDPPLMLQEQCESAPLLVAQESGTAAPEESESGEVQDRAVPRFDRPGMTPAPPRMDFQGAIFENNKLRAKPGYVFEVLPGNRVAAKKPGGGGGGTWDVKCTGCSKKNGKCEMVRSPNEIQCLGNPCTGNCYVDLRPVGGGKLMH